MSNIIECRNLSKDYEDVRALNGVNLCIPDAGGIVGLLGPNGSGKTTLIKLLTGLLQPTEGNVEIAGKKIGVETKAIVSYLSDTHALTDTYTVAKQLDFFEEFFDDFDSEKAKKMISELGIKFKSKIKTLSKGTKEKLSLIFTLSRNARLFILDEPIAGVDPAARDYVLRTILIFVRTINNVQNYIGGINKCIRSFNSNSFYFITGFTNTRRIKKRKLDAFIKQFSINNVTCCARNFCNNSSVFF